MSKSRPNILIIHTDQHRYDCLGAYGNKEIKTPNIDCLAEDSVLYKNSFCPFPVCTPSRYSLLSGLYVHQHLGGNNRSTLPQGMATFPGILQQNGYKTRAVGKMHFTPTYLDLGFEEMVLAEQDGPGRHDDDYHRYLRNKGLVDRIDLMDQVQEYRQQAPAEYWQRMGAIQSNLAEEDYSTSWIADQAMQALENWDTGDNLLMVGFIKPHHPFDPPSPWSEMYNPDDLSLLPGWAEACFDRDIKKNEGYFFHSELTEDKLKQVMAYYYASISQIDFHVGRMIDLLKNRGIYDNTLVIFTSDHGEYLGFHHLLLKANYMYDPLVKVPLLIKYPESKDGGTVSDKLVNNLDLAPTILKQADCCPASTMKGYDLSLDNGREYIFAQHGTEEYMVRSSKFKLLLCREEEQSQFFDLERDPLETNNLYGQREYGNKINEYKEILFRWLFFDEPTGVYKNEKEPVITAANVFQANSQREESISYYRDKMEGKK